MSEQMAGQSATANSHAGHSHTSHAGQGSAGHGNELLVELTAEIVAAYVSNHVVPVSELSTLIGDVHNALNNTGAPAPVAAAVEKPKPAVSVRKSVQDGQITCLECGGNFK